MNLIDIVNRPLNPAPWAEGEKIPWDEPEFSARMLHEHLSQKHDAASRRLAPSTNMLHGCITPSLPAALATSSTLAAAQAYIPAAWPNWGILV